MSAALSSTSPIQNASGSPTSPNDLNDTKISVETVPKPRKFFKSRNNAPPAEIQQQMAMQQQLAMQQSHNHIPPPSSSDEHPSPQKQTKKKQASPRKQRVERPKVEKPLKPEKQKKPPPPPKVKKEKPAPKQVDPEPDASDDSDQASPARRGRSQIEPTRASGRSRGKVNYNEEQGEEEFLIRTEKRVAPRHLRTHASQDSLASQVSTPLHSPSEQMLESPVAASQNPSDNASSNQSAAIHPPIVLRISKVSV
jgi:hypothetical protein